MATLQSRNLHSVAGVIYGCARFRHAACSASLGSGPSPKANRTGRPQCGTDNPGVQHQREMTLSRRADLLATLAYVRNGDATTIKDASQNPGQFGECDLLALADRKGKIIALQTTTSRLSIATTEKLLRRSFKVGSGPGWWFDGGHLFQVVLQPYYEDEPGKSHLLGTVVVGRGLDATGAGRIIAPWAFTVAVRVSSETDLLSAPSARTITETFTMTR